MSKVAEGLNPSFYEAGYDAEELRHKVKNCAESSPKPPTCARSAPEVYWKRCRDLVQTIMKYVSVKKLAMNLVDPQKRHSIKHVVEKYYDGIEAKVFETEKKDRDKAIEEIKRYNRFCLENDLSQSDPDRLLAILTEPGISKKFYYHIEKHIESGHPMFELEELPMRDFRKKVSN